MVSGLERFALALYAPLAAHLGWEPVPGELHLNALLRTLCNGRAAQLGDAKALKEARAPAAWLPCASPLPYRMCSTQHDSEPAAGVRSPRLWNCEREKGR